MQSASRLSSANISDASTSGADTSADAASPTAGTTAAAIACTHRNASHCAPRGGSRCRRTPPGPRVFMGISDPSSPRSSPIGGPAAPIGADVGSAGGNSLHCQRSKSRSAQRIRVPPSGGRRHRETTTSRPGETSRAMSAELLVNVTPRETRVALIESGLLQEIFIERAHRRGLVGNIYKGRVCRVLPGMQAAFVDIGLDRAAFLHASDIADADARRVHDAPGADAPTPAKTAPASMLRNGASITDLVHDGQEVLVQVIKDPLGSKGARLTTHVSVPSCYLVYMPGGGTIGVSQRIEDEDERKRLREMVRDCARHADGNGRTPDDGPGEDWTPGRRIHRAHCGGRVPGRGRRGGHGVSAQAVDFGQRARRRRQRARHRARGPDARHPHAARAVRHDHRAGKHRLARDARARARLHGPFPARDEPPHRALHRRGTHLRALRGGGRDSEVPSPQGAAQVRRAHRDRPDRGDDHGRRQHRRIRRTSQLRGDHLQDQPRRPPRPSPGSCACATSAASSSSTSSTWETRRTSARCSARSRRRSPATTPGRTSATCRRSAWWR